MVTLEEVAGAFESWRNSRESRKSPLPDELWSMVKALVPYYKKSHIQKVLRLSGSQFNQHCIELASQKTFKDVVVPPVGEGFVLARSNAVMQNADPIQEVIELSLKGQHKSLCIKATMQQLPKILFLLEQHL